MSNNFTYIKNADNEDNPLIKNFIKSRELSSMKISNNDRKKEIAIWEAKKRLEKIKSEDLLLGKAKEYARERRLSKSRISKRSQELNPLLKAQLALNSK